MRKILLFTLSALLLLSACAAPTEEPPDWENYDPFGDGQQGAVPLDELLPPTRTADQAIQTPTPNAPRFAAEAEQGPDFKIIPDSELVRGPASLLLNMDVYMRTRSGYIKSYQEEVEGELLSGLQIVEKVSLDYSVNPRLLLALIEYQSGWISRSAVEETDYPMRYYEDWTAGLYRQLKWTANELNRGYYLWQANEITEWTLVDGSLVGINPNINAGTAALQNYFALLYTRDVWEYDVTSDGFFATYQAMFGYPFDYAIEPLIPADVVQPQLTLPFGRGEIWHYTGGPHGGWDTGSAWAALDFAAPGDPTGCLPPDAWVRSASAGTVVRSENGAVVVDLDGDGYEETGWTLLYMHMATDGRVPKGTQLQAGDRIGHPSCEGGFSNASHLHLARRYNGEWIPAHGNMPFDLDGWLSSSTGDEYDGYLTRGEEFIEAWDGQNELNEISR